MKPQKLLGVDAGGTFTDFIYIEIRDEVSIRVHKALSTPEAPQKAILRGIEDLGLSESAQDGTLQIVHGSTVATNAVLEGKVATTAFITNYGFKDLLTLGRQTRPGLYDLEFAPIPPPVPRNLCLETGGRIAADGSTLDELTDEEVNDLVEQIISLNPESVAINLLFSFLNDGFERTLEAALKKSKPSLFVSRSSSVLPVYREYERGIATWLNASLEPVMSNYLNSLEQELGPSSFQIMQSSGETIAAEKAARSSVSLLLSGPAAGLRAIQYIGEQVGVSKIISFDMGGTSTDVALIDGKIETTIEGRIGRYPVGVPMLDMHTIGAGGGSIAFIDDGGLLRVGPRSAGAAPGPICYQNGGTEVTVTDASLVLGRLPRGIKLAGGLSLSVDKAHIAIKNLGLRLGLTAEETAEGTIRIANEHMSKAIRMISVNKGYDPKEFMLASFGGAGGLHICEIADAMQIERAIVPAYGGILSAMGMLISKKGRQYTRTINTIAEISKEAEIKSQLTEMLNTGQLELISEGVEHKKIEATYSLDCRYKGQSYTLNVEWFDIITCQKLFKSLHSQRYGYSLSEPIEIVNLKVSVQASGASFALPQISKRRNSVDSGTVDVYGQRGKAKIYRKENLEVGFLIPGPAIIEESTSTIFISQNWQASLDAFGNTVLSRT
ncbi:hydantoinase/oxoprolinase family protein [Gammaproteobacteria bacterium]|nr:hydantoinase/oxoprolinase family protein [Gammaproteobacteria bacterium]